MGFGCVGVWGLGGWGLWVWGLGVGSTFTWGVGFRDFGWGCGVQI